MTTTKVLEMKVLRRIASEMRREKGVLGGLAERIKMNEQIV